MNIESPNLVIHNKYTIQVIEKDTGKIMQEAYGYNKANSKFFTYKSAVETAKLVYLFLGVGEAQEDKLEEKIVSLWNYYSIKLVESNTIPVFENKQYSGTVTVPTSEGNADLTEIAIGYRYTQQNSSIYEYYSHAWLVDAEGNPIIINKTETQELRITVDIYFSVLFPIEKNKYNFLYFPEDCSCLAGITTNSNYYYLGEPKLPSNHCREFFLSPLISPPENLERKGFTQFGMPTGGPPSRNAKMSGTAISLTQSSEKNVFPIELSINNKKFDITENLIGYAHSIIFSDLGVIPLPNEEICPKYKYSEFSVGTGDGEKKHWHPRLDEIVIEDTKIYITENSKVKNQIIGQYNFISQSVENGDVAFVNFDVTKSPLWNKCIRIDYYSSAEEEDFVFSREPNKRVIIDHISSGGIIALTNFSFTNSENVIGDATFTSSYFAPHSYKSWNGGKTLKIIPIYYDENGVTLDHILVGKLFVDGYSDVKTTAMYSIQISEDGIEWTSIYTTSGWFNAEYFYKEDGSKYTSKWWKFEPTMKSSGNISTTYSHEDEYNWDGKKGMDLKYFVLGNSSEYDFGKIGLNFKEPPAEGAVITMDAVLNLPYKDPEIISYHSAKISISNPEPELETEEEGTV